jgi:uncharacterized protein
VTPDSPNVVPPLSRGRLNLRKGSLHGPDRRECEDDPVPHKGVPVGRVRALYRYLVKSTAGQSLQAADVTAQGLLHDRRWAAYTDDGGIASGKRTRRFRPVIGLMRWTSSMEGGEVPVLVSPDGARYRVDDPAASEALTAAFGRKLVLRPESNVAHHDDSPIHLLTTSSLAAVERLLGATVDHRRFRANIVIDTGIEPVFIENGWTGTKLALGEDVVLGGGPGMPRCVMVDQDQAGVTAEPKTLKAISAHNGMDFGLQAQAGRSGTVRVGDLVTVSQAT